MKLSGLDIFIVIAMETAMALPLFDSYSEFSFRLSAIVTHDF